MKTIKEAQAKNDTENKVDAFLSNLGVTYSVFPAGTGLKRGNWECDGWRVVFGKADISQSFDYYTGTGHRVISTFDKSRVMYDYKNASARNRQYHLDSLAKPFAPFAASVLYALINDAQASDQSFNSWCADYGYDSDSMKAFKLYQACCETGEKLNSIFSRQQISELAELLADY